MSADLLGTIKLLHRVFGFLAGQSAEQLAGIVDGRVQLSLSGIQTPPPGKSTATPPLEEVSVTPPPRKPLAKPARKPPVTPPPPADADFAEVAAELRRQESVDAGSAYLEQLKVSGHKPTKADLTALAEAMGLTLPKSVTVPMAKRKLVEHAIGARIKYAGLASW